MNNNDNYETKFKQWLYYERYLNLISAGYVYIDKRLKIRNIPILLVLLRTNIYIILLLLLLIITIHLLFLILLILTISRMIY